MNTLRYLLRFIIFFLFFFLSNRILFILFFINEVTNFSLFEVLKIIPNSFPLDISFISYLLVIITLLLWLNSYFWNRFFSKIAFVLTSCIIITSSLIIGGEVALYSEWKTKLNFTALSHFANPSEVFSTASAYHIFTTIFFVLVGIIFIRIFKKKVHPFFPKHQNENTFRKVIIGILLLPFIFGVLLIGIRGGFKEIPVNLSDAYFSKNIILNDIAVNPNWNVLQSIYKSTTNLKGNPYQKYSDKECDEYIKSLYKTHNDSTILLLKTQRPNIVFIILESWSADNVESLGGLEGITPNFKALEKEGCLFANFYSNGWTSDQGMSAIFSSFPVFPYVSIVNQADKSRKLTTLNRSLNSYHSSFFFGGQLTYGNIKSYLLSQGFDVVRDKNSFNHLPSGALGVHDEFMFTQFKDELNNLPQPFMSTLFSISSHSPYDFPGEHKLSFESKEDKYVNSVAYTDKCLGEFMESVKKEKWYDNTLFVIVADHSHNSPRGWRVAQKERFKIPMLWFGEVLKEEIKGTQNNTLGSHIDIAPSLLVQLNLPNKEYIWGKNLFNHKLERAVPYAFHKGFGLIREKCYYAFSESYNRIIECHAENKAEEEKIKEQAEMYFQAAFKDYMDL